jgi:multiple sugar transport system permease protein
MNRAVQRKLLRSARMTTLYIVVVGVICVIVFPMYFLVMMSFMSDYEAYDWPLPLVPAFKVQYKIEQTEEGYHLNILNRQTEEYERFGPVSFSSSNDDLYTVYRFLRRQSNCIVEVEELAGLLSEVGRGNPVEFAVRKNLLLNYIVFFDVTRDALPAFMRSIYVALFTILISLSIGGMAGYAFARYFFKGKNALKLGVLFVRMFPGVAIAIPMVIILGRIGLYDQPFGLSLIYSVTQIALTIWITASIFLAIPVELEEAALIFGTTKAGAFWHITLPLALPGLAACAMYAFIGSWNEVIQAVVFTSFNPTFPVVVYQVLVGAKGNINLVAAGSLTQALPAVVFTLIIRRYLLRMWGGVRV